MAKGFLNAWLRRLWRALGSNWFTLALLASLLSASLLASLFPQMPADPAAHTRWLASVSLRYGTATPLLQTLGLFDAYHSAWYVLLLVGVILNLVACTLQRLPWLWRTLTRPPRIARGDTFYQSFAHRREWPGVSSAGGLAAIQAILPKHRYRLTVEPHEARDAIYVFAQRGRWAQASSLTGHLSAILLVLAVAARPALSWQSTAVTLLPGQEYPLDPVTPVTLRTGDLQVDVYPDGQPRDVRVPLVVLEGSSAVTETVRMNQPLTHRGLVLHLVGYGPGAQIDTPEGSFDLTFRDGQAQEVALTEAGLALRVAPQAGSDTLFVEVWDADGVPLGAGIVADGQEVRAGPVALVFDLRRFTVLQVSRDPTFGPVVAAASLMLVAMLVCLWVPQRRIWLRLGNGSVQMVGSGDMDWEFDALARDIAEMLESEKATGHG